MKLIRFGEPGNEKPGVLLDGEARVDASAAVSDYDEAFFAGNGLTELGQWIARDASRAPRVNAGVRWAPPVRRPGKIICIGLNYRDHAAETGAKIPAEPVVFSKAVSALAGPNDGVTLPRGAEKLDWEAELAVVIGKRASYVTQSQALEFVAGYAILNDYSERGFQLERGGQWTKGKSADTFAPLGPFVATRDEIAEPPRLGIWLKVNGEVRQKSNTANMIFDVPTIVSYVSQFMTLHPADIISTGTPGGVAMGMKTPVYLKPGDVVELGIDGLGSARQVVSAWRG